MISQERFEDKLKWLSEVTGSAIRKTTSEALWEEFRDIDIRDFESGIKDLAYTDDKVNLNNLWKHISRHQSKRMEQESLDFKHREEEEFRRWWKDHGGSRQNCINEYKCFDCKREYCDVIAKDAVRCLKAVLKDEMSKFDMNEQLAKYKGMGWNIPELEPF